MPEIIAAHAPYEDAIIAVCSTIDKILAARQAEMALMTKEQLNARFERESKGEQVAFDIFVQPLINLVDLIKRAKNERQN